MKEIVILNKDIKAFKKHLLLEEKAENTVEKYMRDATSFLMFAKTDNSIFQGVGSENIEKNGNENVEMGIRKETIIAYKNYLINQGYAKRSINSMLCSVNAFLTFLGYSDCKVKLLKQQQDVFCDKSRELTKMEFDRLCDTALSSGNKRLYMLLQTLCGAGIRVSEVRFVTVEAVRKGEATVTLKGKTRTVFFVKALRKKLLSYAKENSILSGQIFITKTGKPMNRTNIWREMKNLCRKAKVDKNKVFPHNLRHLFAKVFYALNKDIAKLADILGHSSIETTRIYIASSGTEHRRIMENMHLIC